MSIGGRDWKAMWLGLLEASLLVTALFSFATSFDEWHRLLELFSHFRLQYLVIAALLTCAFLFLRWPGYILLGLATIAVNAWHVAPWYLPVEHSPVADSDIRILHANILVSNDSSDRFFMAVTKADPDIVVMQEATPEWLSSLGSLDSIYPYKLVESRNDPFGIALYSKYPFESSVVNAAEPFGFPQTCCTHTVATRRNRRPEYHDVGTPLPLVRGQKQTQERTPGFRHQTDLAIVLAFRDDSDRPVPRFR